MHGKAPRRCVQFEGVSFLQGGRLPWDGQMVHSGVLRVRIEPGIPKLLVKINPTDAEAFHAKNLGEVTLRKGVTSRSQARRRRNSCV